MRIYGTFSDEEGDPGVWLEDYMCACGKGARIIGRIKLIDNAEAWCSHCGVSVKSAIIDVEILERMLID